MKNLLLTFATIFVSASAFGQAYPNQMPPPHQYKMKEQGESVDQIMINMQKACANKAPGSSPTYTRQARLQDIEILWNEDVGLYLKGLCVVQFTAKTLK